MSTLLKADAIAKQGRLTDNRILDVEHAMRTLKGAGIRKRLEGLSYVMIAQAVMADNRIIEAVRAWTLLCLRPGRAA